MNQRMSDLDELRQSGPYRVGVIGLRFMMLTPVIMMVLVVASLVGAATILIKGLVLVLALVMVGSIALVWVVIVPLTSKTRRYVSASSAGLDLRRGSLLIRAILRDVWGWRTW